MFDLTAYLGEGSAEAVKLTFGRHTCVDCTE